MAKFRKSKFGDIITPAVLNDITLIDSILYLCFLQSMIGKKYLELVPGETNTSNHQVEKYVLDKLQEIYSNYGSCEKDFKELGYRLTVVQEQVTESLVDPSVVKNFDEKLKNILIRSVNELKKFRLEW